MEPKSDNVARRPTRVLSATLLDPGTRSQVPGRMPRISVALIRRDLSRSSRLCLQCWGESMCRSRVRIWSVHCASIVLRSLFCVGGRHQTRFTLKPICVQPMREPVA